MRNPRKSQVSEGKIIVILGPTASGKSAWAVELAREFNGEIINADSRQIYRGMDIGTNKPTPEEMASVPHHLSDIKNPDEEFSVKEYKDLAIKTIREILARGNVPFLVGGTGLYIQAVAQNLEIPKVPPQKALREKLEEKSLEELLHMLERLDPEAARRVDRKNKRRIIRAIEVTLGGPAAVEPRKGPKLFDALQIGIDVPREELYRRIEERTQAMVEAGLVEEVESLLARYPFRPPALSGIGYKEIIAHLEGKLTLEQALREIIKNTKAYARRQMTWFKKDHRIVWLNSLGNYFEEAEKRVAEFLGDAEGTPVS